MRLLLIRHGETEHNVAGLLAGVTDSRLTNHGAIQAQRLGAHLVSKRQLRFTHVFASDLQRALRTARGLCEAQNAGDEEAQPSLISLSLLREQDFGSFELLPWNRSEDARRKDPDPTNPGFRPKEPADALKMRADTFLDDFLVPLFVLDEESELVVAVVSHGLFLAALWKCLLFRFKTSNIILSPDVFPPSPSRPLEHLPAWTNTGFLELEIRQLSNNKQEQRDAATGFDQADTSNAKLNARMKICAVNSKEHLANLKRTRGGVGSSASDDKQKRLDTFFKKPRIAE